MPLRDHAESFQTLEYFQLMDSELHALSAFNTAVQTATHKILANIPLQKDSSPVTLNRFKENILAQSKWQPVLQLPACFEKLSAAGIFKLAFHPAGGYFYTYLNNILCAEIQNSFDSEQSFASFIAFNDYLNTRNRKELKLNTAKKHHPLYLEIESFFEPLRFTDDTLLYTNGKPLEWLCSFYLEILIVRQKISSAIKLITPDIICQVELSDKEEVLLQVAASHGSYRAAFDLCVRLESKIDNSASLEEADQLYHDFHQTVFLPLLLPPFQTVAYLLLVPILQSRLNHCDHPAAKLLDSETRIFRKQQLIIDIYQTLSKAKQAENTCKNAFRLAYKDDTCQPRLHELFVHNPAMTAQNYENLGAVMRFFQQTFPTLRGEFERLVTPESSMAAPKP